MPRDLKPSALQRRSPETLQALEAFYSLPCEPIFRTDRQAELCLQLPPDSSSHGSRFEATESVAASDLVPHR